MNLDRIRRMIAENNNEIANISERRTIYHDYSNEACADRKAFLEEENVKLQEFLKICESNTKKVSELLKRKNGNKENDQNIDKEIAEIEKKLNAKKKAMKLTEQGKFQNVVCTVLGQWDKKIHNKLYNGSQKADQRFENHRKRIENRYKWSGLLKYVGIRAAIAAIAFIPGVKLGLGAAYTIVAMANSAFVTNTLIRATLTVYNKLRYGGPLIEKMKRVYKGNYIENVSNADFEMERTSKVNIKDFFLDNNKVNINTNTNSNDDTVDRVNINTNTNSLTDEFVRQTNIRIRNINISLSSLEDLMAIKIDADLLVKQGKLDSNLIDKYNDILVEIDKRKLATSGMNVGINNRIRNLNIKNASLEELMAIKIDVEQLKNQGVLENDLIEKYNEILVEIQKRKIEKSKFEDRIKEINNCIRNFDYQNVSLEELTNKIMEADDLFHQGQLDKDVIDKYKKMLLEYQKRTMMNAQIRNFDIEKASLEELMNTIVEADGLKSNVLMEKDTEKKYYEIIKEYRRRESENRKNDKLKSKEELVNNSLNEENDKEDFLTMVYSDINIIKKSVTKKERTIAIKKFLFDIESIKKNLPKVKAQQFSSFEKELLEICSIIEQSEIQEYDSKKNKKEKQKKRMMALNRLSEIIYDLHDPLFEMKKRKLELRIKDNAGHMENDEIDELSNLIHKEDPYDYNDYIADMASEYAKRKNNRHK